MSASSVLARTSASPHAGPLGRGVDGDEPHLGFAGPREARVRRAGSQHARRSEQPLAVDGDEHRSGCRAAAHIPFEGTSPGTHGEVAVGPGGECPLDERGFCGSLALTDRTNGDRGADRLLHRRPA
ncbi:hypothetical protein DCE94_13975 [Agromyces badenianii]|nr:hypothetical protein DCE94_13975 [Agromyces badenianii]